MPFGLFNAPSDVYAYIYDIETVREHIHILTTKNDTSGNGNGIGVHVLGMRLGVRGTLLVRAFCYVRYR